MPNSWARLITAIGGWIVFYFTRLPNVGRDQGFFGLGVCLTLFVVCHFESEVVHEPTPDAGAGASMTVVAGGRLM